MDKLLLSRFNEIITYVSPRIQYYLKNISENTINNIQEIRIRSNRPIVIVTSAGSSFLNKSGKLCYILSSNCVTATENEINDCVNKMCGYSMHSHYEDILNGYITLPNGSRVGLTGTAVYDKNEVKGMKNIDGINIRIPRFISGISESLFNSIFEKNTAGLAIVGPPSSGKTTLLKDLVYQFSSGRTGKYYKVCVIDERKEIISSHNDYSLIGLNTDVLYGYPKSKGISMAVRTLSPDIIVCDEIDSNEVDTIVDVMNTGVCFIVSVHALNFEELKRKKFYKLMIDNKCINYIALLKGCHEPGTISKIIKIDGEINENFVNYNDINSDHYNSIELYKNNQTAYKSG